MHFSIIEQVLGIAKITRFQKLNELQATPHVFTIYIKLFLNFSIYAI